MASQRNLKATSAGTGGILVWPGVTLSMPCALTLTHTTGAGDPTLIISSGGSAANPALVIADDNTGFFSTGAGTLGATCNGTDSLTITTTGINLPPAGGLYKIAGTQVLKARITGWTVPSATKTRTGFANFAGTISDPPTQAEMQGLRDYAISVAEHLAALLENMHGTAGHGLIGT